MISCAAHHAQPRFLALLDGRPIAAGHHASEAERLAHRRLVGRACPAPTLAAHHHLDVAPASCAAIYAWGAEGPNARIVPMLVSPAWMQWVVLTEEEAELHRAACTEIVGYAAHTYLAVDGFGATEDEAWERGRQSLWDVDFEQDPNILETCEVTAAGMALLKDGVNLKLNFDAVPGEYREPEFVADDLYLAHIPGAPVTALIACAGFEAKALHAIDRLVSRTDESLE